MRPASFTGAHVPSTPSGMSGFQRLNMSGSSAAGTRPPAERFAQAEGRQQQRADDEHDRLHRLGVGHRPQAAEHRVEPRSAATTSTDPTQKLLNVVADL
jgi:hypothetical protein